jgi:site-specific recombinase XerD
MATQFHEDTLSQEIVRLRKRLRELPPFVQDFFRGIADTTSMLTRIGYAYDLKIFFVFLSEERLEMDGKPVREFSLEDLKKISVDTIEEFMEYLGYYVRNEQNKTYVFQNDESGKSRKLAAVRSFLDYYYRKRAIDSNPAMLVDFPKMHDKLIIRLEPDEVAQLLEEVESGAHLSKWQQNFHKHTKIRDTAILSLMLGTGMRVSECVGIDIEHVDFTQNGVKVLRKGGDEAVLYFGEEVEMALKEYIEMRTQISPLKKDNHALFLSMQRKRIGVRAVENLVKKYAKLVNALKNISPHKLRSTYGTQLYQETGDIYLVADVLGHADVNTTRRHYAHMSEARRKSAAQHVHLRNSTSHHETCGQEDVEP